MYEIYAAGAAAAFTVDCLVYPLDTLKTRYQSQDFLKTFASRPGEAKVPVFRGLYQGIGSVIVATLPAAGIFFATYESMKQSISLAVPMAPQPLVHSSASAIAEMASCVVLAPAEVVKQNAQMLRRQQQNGTRASSSTSLQAVYQIAASGARKRLFTGYTALVARNLPFTALQFPIFEHLRDRIWDRTDPSQARSRQRKRKRERGLLETAVVNGVSAGAAGAMAAFVTAPSDVVKTRMMLSAGDGEDPKDPASTRSRSDPETCQNRSRSRSSWSTAREVYRNNGLRGLFRGGLLRSVWTALGSGLYLGTYEMSKVWLTRDKTEQDVLGEPS
ncbi:mitochondrial carrier [Sodiomyces alkalinus F11]|uniref:Mitochondrial carrier n=1 Tax=Sodiomyces alkalinus (strain CBS 110278 / VKM F-3762 / F11) TaxID=1314773 RepID=A0A3N2PQA9_SODAK|nr:mitochondrial carrier [Sodiomyces alkalinus F11]ROT36697.1 mitochondrial carrier [Sodiomyces alkalinus F11]